MIGTSKGYFDSLGGDWDQFRESFFSEKVREKALELAAKDPELHRIGIRPRKRCGALGLHRIPSEEEAGHGEHRTTRFRAPASGRRNGGHRPCAAHRQSTYEHRVLAWNPDVGCEYCHKQHKTCFSFLTSLK